MLEPKEVLIYLAHKYNGDWHSIYEHIKNKKIVHTSEVKECLENLKSAVITIFDDEYPAGLKNIYCPPLVLFYKGDISLLTHINKKLSVVGSRECSLNGKTVTEKIISELPQNIIIVSGLAIGIDTIAHSEAIKTNKKTIAVLGCGINLCYTESNKDVYEEISKNHLLISEYPDTTNPQPKCFPFRNRIIAALGDALLVPQARIPSGTAHTINFALSVGKTIMAVPHSPMENYSCNSLIRSGATLVESGDDVMEELIKKF